MPEPITAEHVVAALTIETQALLGSPGAGTKQWTSTLLGALAKLGDVRHLCVEPSLHALRERPGHAEFLWDLTISTWPRYGGTDPKLAYPDYYQNACPELVLVAESEWGKLRDPHANGSAVLEDFSKLLAARCPLKVMIFSYHPNAVAARHSSYVELVTLMEGLIDRSLDTATYVLFGIAWDVAVPGFEQRIFRARQAG